MKTRYCNPMVELTWWWGEFSGLPVFTPVIRQDGVRCADHPILKPCPNRRMTIQLQAEFANVVITVLNCRLPQHLRESLEVGFTGGAPRGIELIPPLVRFEELEPLIMVHPHGHGDDEAAAMGQMVSRIWDGYAEELRAIGS